MYKKDNFFTNTSADFKKVAQAPDRPADFTKLYHRKARCYKDEAEYDRYEYISRDADGNITDFGSYTTSPSGEDGCENFTVIEDCDDYVLGQADEGEISSEYWYDENGVYRKGAYWGEMGTCFWTIDGFSSNASEVFVGFCKWEDFHITEDDEDDDDYDDDGLEPYEFSCPVCGITNEFADDSCHQCGCKFS